MFLFPRRAELLSSLSGLHKPVVDTWFAYTPVRFYDLAQRLGEEGRRIYALSEVSLDAIYPVVLNLLLHVALAILLPAAFKPTVRVQQLVSLPLSSLASDYLENAGITALLLSYPNQIIWLAWVTSLMTVIKFLLYLACLGLVLISAIIVAKQRLAMRRRA